MNYKNGREVKVNDSVIGVGEKLKRNIAGTVIKLQPATKPNDTDKIVVFVPVSNTPDSPKPTVTIIDEIVSPSDFNHVDDVLNPEPAQTATKTA